MEFVNIEKLADYKILPFDIFDEQGNLLYSAGEVLTPGKIIQLKDKGQIFRSPSKKQKENFEQSEPIEKKESYDAPKKQEEKIEEADLPIQEQIIENVNIQTSSDYVSPLDKVNENNYIGPVNITSSIDTKTQIKLKSYYYQIHENFEKNNSETNVKNILVVRNKILNDLTKSIEKTRFFSELKLVGEYSKCHDLNVAILANAFAMKYGMRAKDIQDLVLAALLHDIGKKYLPQELINKASLNQSEKQELENHTKIGYNVIIKKLKLPPKIALPALQHHEHINGTGYPQKISEENIDIFSQIIGICSAFDNLTFNRTDYKVKNVHEALRYIMEKWKEFYSSDILYTFIYMFSYDDIKSFDEMVI